MNSRQTDRPSNIIYNYNINNFAYCYFSSGRGHIIYIYIYIPGERHIQPHVTYRYSIEWEHGHMIVFECDGI